MSESPLVVDWQMVVADFQAVWGDFLDVLGDVNRNMRRTGTRQAKQRIMALSYAAGHKARTRVRNVPTVGAPGTSMKRRRIRYD